MAHRPNPSACFRTLLCSTGSSCYASLLFLHGRCVIPDTATPECLLVGAQRFFVFFSVVLILLMALTTSIINPRFGLLVKGAIKALKGKSPGGGPRKAIKTQEAIKAVSEVSNTNKAALAAS